jgi:hypothetical protein
MSFLITCRRNPTAMLSAGRARVRYSAMSMYDAMVTVSFFMLLYQPFRMFLKREKRNITIIYSLFLRMLRRVTMMLQFVSC